MILVLLAPFMASVRMSVMISARLRLLILSPSRQDTTLRLNISLSYISLIPFNLLPEISSWSENVSYNACIVFDVEYEA